MTKKAQSSKPVQVMMIDRPKRKKARRSRKAGAPGAVGLDAGGAAYARLLMDPCNAPLVHPVYPGGDAGFLFRAESFSNFGGGVGETAGTFHWTPGYVNASTSELIVNGSVAGGTTGSFVINSSSPGRGFLTSNSKGMRCVAACVKVTYPGAESTRAGRVHYGLTNAGMIDVGNSLTPDAVAQTLQHYSRTPAETFEIIWKPNVADTEFNDPTETSGALIRDRKSSVTVSWAGLPAAIGLTFHMTAIYEWTPATGLGVGHNALGKNQSRNTLDDVVDSVIKSGFGFVRNSAAAVGYGIGAGVTNTVARAFGSMPARPMSRNVLVY